MPKITLQVHPLAYPHVLERGVDPQRGTGRTTAIILDGIVRLQKEGYTSDRSVFIKDHFEGTQANLNVFADRVRFIVKCLDMRKYIEVVQHNKDVELKWIINDEAN